MDEQLNSPPPTLTAYANDPVLGKACMALQERSRQDDLATTQRRLKEAEARRQQLRPQPRLSATAPVSLVARPYAGYATTPEGWRRRFSVTNPKEVAACDQQIEQGLRVVQRAERERFQFLLKAQERAKTAPAGSGSAAGVSPQRQLARQQHEQAVREEAQRQDEARAIAVEQAAAEKQARLQARAAEAQARLASRAAQIGQSVDAAVAAAAERALERDGMRQAVLSHELQQRGLLRLTNTQRRAAREAVQHDARITVSTRLRLTAAQRAEEHSETMHSRAAAKAEATQMAADAADARQRAQHAAQSQKLSASWNARTQRVDAQRGVHDQAREAYLAELRARCARREAVAAQRAAEHAAREREVAARNTQQMLTKFWQQEFATRALVQNKMPDTSMWQQELKRIKAPPAVV